MQVGGVEWRGMTLSQTPGHWSRTCSTAGVTLPLLPCEERKINPRPTGLAWSTFQLHSRAVIWYWLKSGP